MQHEIEVAAARSLRRSPRHSCIVHAPTRSITPASRRIRLVFVILGLGMSLDGCQRRDDASVSVERTVRGDTVVVLTRGATSVTRADTVRIIARDPSLEAPTAMVMARGLLVVGDRTTFHVVDPSTGTMTTFGRSGEGPGEFRSISAIIDIGSDTIGVFDSRLLRLSLFDHDFGFLRSETLAPRPPFVNRRRPRDAMVRLGSGLLMVRQENLRLERPTRTALVWQDRAAAKWSEIEVWDDLLFRNLPGGMVGPAELFAPRAILAVSRAGEVAYGDGLDYCIALRRYDDDGMAINGVAMVRREWSRAETGSAITHPDFSEIEDADLRRYYEGTARIQKVPDHVPSFDALQFDELGRLWVRTIGTDAAAVHPALLARIERYQPTHRRWDVFGSDHTLLGTVEMPAAFEPLVIGEDEAFGFAALESGEIAIGKVRFRKLRDSSSVDD